MMHIDDDDDDYDENQSVLQDSATDGTCMVYCVTEQF